MATKWTQEKDNVIISEVAKNPEHLRNAFKSASIKINKTAESICTRYYNHINKSTI